MTTKKLLVAFDPQKPEKRSSDFLTVVLEQQEPKLMGLKSKKMSACGMMVYLGKEITANDLFAKLVDSGRKVENIQKTLNVLQAYIQMLQDFRIGNILVVQADAASGFKLLKLADAPPSPGSARRLP
jgi:hypothetical protein